MSFLIGDASVFEGENSLSEYIMGFVEQWRQDRDAAHHDLWTEYWELWRTRKEVLRHNDPSTKSRAVMPAIMQAVDAAVAEMEESTFGRQRWFDIEDDSPTPEARLLADQLLFDLERFKAPVNEIFLIGAVFGTGIGKIAVGSGMDNSISLKLVPIMPMEFGIDPGATNIDEAHGIFHEFIIPKAVVTQRQREGVYARIDPGTDHLPRHMHDFKRDDASVMNSDTVHMVEYHGLVPRELLPEEQQPIIESLEFDEEELVESIVTIANSNVVLKAVANPFTRRDRGFVAYQHDTVPRRFWGRGIPEKGYWPQKVLDMEVRARNDSLALNARPMLAVNRASGVAPRDLEARAGRVVQINNPTMALKDAISPLVFPSPDPQTYQQSQQMERMVDMATGGFQTPHNASGRETTTGITQLNASAIRRTKRTMRNVEDQFLLPLVRRSLWRFQQFEPERYPRAPLPLKIKSTLGMVAREFEQQQLATIMTNLGDGPAQLLVFRTIIENSGLIDRERILAVVDLMLEQSLNPQPERDLSGESRMLNTQLNFQKFEMEKLAREIELSIENAKIQAQQDSTAKNHQRGMIALNLDAERIEAEAAKDRADAIKKAVEAETLGLRTEMETLRQALAIVTDASTLDDALGEVRPQVLDFGTPTEDVIEVPAPRTGAEPEEEALVEAAAPIGPSVLNIERDDRGLISAVNGVPPTRNEQGLITELPLNG